MNNNVNNTYNFFEIKESEQIILFWGMDIQPKKILLIPSIKEIVKKHELPYDEVIEIFDDDTYEFYKVVYKN